MCVCVGSTNEGSSGAQERKKRVDDGKKVGTHFWECHHRNVICPSVKIFNIFKILRDNSIVNDVFHHMGTIAPEREFNSL